MTPRLKAKSVAAGPQMTLSAKPALRSGRRAKPRRLIRPTVPLRRQNRRRPSPGASKPSPCYGRSVFAGRRLPCTWRNTVRSPHLPAEPQAAVVERAIVFQPNTDTRRGTNPLLHFVATVECRKIRNGSPVQVIPSTLCILIAAQGLFAAEPAIPVAVLYHHRLPDLELLCS